MLRNNPEKLKFMVENIKGSILTNLKSIEVLLIEAFQYYIESQNKNISNQLEIIRKRVFELRDIFNKYRIPPILLKDYQNEINLVNQFRIVSFYFELILLESEDILNNFKGIIAEINIVSIVQSNIDLFLKSFNRIKELLGQLESYGSLNHHDDIFKDILSKMKKLYQNPETIDKIKNLIGSLELISKSILNEALNKSALREDTRNKLIEIINSISESEMIKECGGVININKLLNLIKENNVELKFTLSELIKALKFMKKKGFINDIEKFQHLKLVKFFPLELSNDPKIVINFTGSGMTTKEELIKKLNWTESRVENVITFLINKGVCKSEHNALTGNKLYFPGIIK